MLVWKNNNENNLLKSEKVQIRISFPATGGTLNTKGGVSVWQGWGGTFFPLCDMSLTEETDVTVESN